jgi:23S rRNA (cytosine1962-C5)-methyltransferase
VAPKPPAELPKVLEADVSDAAPGMTPKPTPPAAPVQAREVAAPTPTPTPAPAHTPTPPIQVRTYADPRAPEAKRFDHERSHAREHEARPPKPRATRPPETFQQPPAEGEPAAVVNRKGAERFAQGHPWVYESDVLALSPHAKSGEVVRVLDGRGWFIGRAALSLQSKIRLRLLSREEVPADKAFFKARLEAAIALRKMAYPTEQSYRVVHGEADQIPGLIVDKYGDHVTIQLLTQHADANRAMWIELVNELLAPVCIVERSDVKVRALEGLEPVKGVVSGTLRPGLTYKEGSVELGLDLVDGQKTGSFLDQRENHITAGLYAHGKALDCFSYVGGFALQMAKAGAEVTALEISGPACEHIKANGARNGVTINAIEGNAFDYLRDQLDAGTRFDTIVLDPPAFAKSKDAIDAAHRGYKEINLRALQLLNPGGILVTASCSYHVSEDAFENILFDAAKDAQKQVQIIEKRGAGRDHPVLVSLRETRYLKCFVLRVL